jgi:hypothetical protein
VATIFLKLTLYRRLEWIYRGAPDPLKNTLVIAMLKIVIVILWASLLFSMRCHSQTMCAEDPYRFVDSASRTIHYKTDIYRLTRELTAPYSKEILKVRAIFIWITQNIRYDYNFINKGREINIPDCESEANCAEVRLEWEQKYLGRIIKRKRAICDGYARLFRKMCELAGIRCEIIAGYSRNKPYQVGNPGFVNHAWNAVWLDSAYHFVDVTWAAGSCKEDEETGKLLSFKRALDDYYWFTPFHELTRNHYPQEQKWVFEPGYTKEKFESNPYYSADIISEMKLISPASGIIKARKGDTIHFKFSFKDDITHLQINSNVNRNPSIYTYEKKPWHRKRAIIDTVALRKQQYLPFIEKSDVYEFDYVVTDASLYYLDILFDYERVMRFNVEVTP